MRERITFIHQEPSFDPASLDIQEAGLLGPQLETVRQDRLTFPLDELPEHLTKLLGRLDSLYVRWASPRQFQSLEPLASRISPGLHAQFTPSGPDAVNGSEVCALLQQFGPLECTSPKAFTEFSHPASAAVPASSFYQPLEDLHAFIASVTQDFCPELDSVCHARVRSLYAASSLDVSFDKALDAVQVTAFWPLRPQTVAVPSSSSKGRRTEVGIFIQNTPPGIEDHELGLAGVLAVLGEGKNPSPAVFNFPSRHREAEATFTSGFVAPTGLHPTLQLRLSSNLPPGGNSKCTPYAHLTLPKTVFADRYQLADELFLASKNLSGLHYTSLPVDLEAPAYTTETWGSSILLGLAPPSSDLKEPWTAEIPLHLRYLEPSVNGTVDVEVPHPAVFWACEPDTELDKNPFDRTHLGYDDLFEPSTIFWHFTPRPVTGNRLTSPVSVPVLEQGASVWIETGTTVAVALGFAWVLWKILDTTWKAKQKPAPQSSKAVSK